MSWASRTVRHGWTAWPVLVGAAVPAAATSFPVRGVLPSYDAGVYAYVGWMITRGHMPYTDAWDNKGPLTYLLYAVGTWLDPDHGMLVVSVLNLLVVAVLAYRLALVLARPAVAGPVVGVALAVLVHSPELTEALSLGFLLYVALVAARVLVAGRTPTPVQAALAGGCVAAATLLRANNAFVLVPLGLVVCVQRLRPAPSTDPERPTSADEHAVAGGRAVPDGGDLGGGSRPGRGRVPLARRSVAALAVTLGWLVAGAVAVATPVTLWLWRGGALGACLDAAYTGSLSWDLSWSTRVSNTTDLLTGYGLAPLAVWLLLLVLTVLRAGRARRPGTRRLGWALLGGLVVFAVANAAGPGTKYSHYLVVLFPLTLMAALVVLGSAYDWLASRITPRRAVALLTVAALGLLAPQLPDVARRVAHPYDTSSRTSQVRSALVAYVEHTTAPDDKVLMVDFGIFGAQYRRESPTPYYRPSPLWTREARAQIWQRIATDAQAARPALIVFGSAALRDRFLRALPSDQRADVETLLAGYQQEPSIGHYVVYRARP